MQTTIQRDHARTLRKTMTRAERVVWNQLKSRALSGYRFNRQVEIGAYIADFVCRECKVVLELDGDTHFDVAADNRRTAFLEVKGYVVFRAWNTDVYENLEGVLEGLLKILESRTR
jgi:very-short-patch-repair endonuclease